MENKFWKRKLLLYWHRNFKNQKNMSKNLKSSLIPMAHEYDEIFSTETFQETVVTEQAPGDVHENETFFRSITVGCGLIVLITVITIVIVIARRRKKLNDEEQGSSSILVYPSQQGNLPQFLTKEIHFSLPTLRSTSLGNISEAEFCDANIERESLLVPTMQNQRSNSFSCYGLGVIEPALYRNSLDLDEIQWPEGHIGRIWFSLKYEPSTEKLLVSLLKAKNLPSRTVGTVNSCDPFVRLHLIPDERRYLQSKQKKKTCNPYFDETLVFQVSTKDMSDHILKLTMIDGGRTKKRSEIGHVIFPLKEFEYGDGMEQQLFKFDLEKEPQEITSNLGELLISLVYNENLNRLTATVIEAKNLKYNNVRSTIWKKYFTT